MHFICVGTPQRGDSGAADLTYVDASVTALSRHLHRRALVVGKSTVPVGTAARLAELIRATAPAGDQVELAWNPEFLREGFAVDDTMRPDRLVFGVTSAWSEERLRAAFEPVLAQGVPVKVTDLQTAELVKVAANSFLATKISYINAMAEVCEATGADVRDLAEALAYDERIGGRFLRPGLGFGGGCLPKDIRAFAHRAEELGVGQAVGFLREIDGINKRRRSRTVDLVVELCGGDVAEQEDRRAGRVVQARLRRHPRRARTRGGEHARSTWARTCTSSTRPRWRTPAGRTPSSATAPAHWTWPAAPTWSCC
nr:hypothetical protein GCM10020092_049570 [Actinoplanes digitatis]